MLNLDLSNTKGIKILRCKKFTPQEIGSLSVLCRSGFKMDLCWSITLYILQICGK